MSLFPAMDHVSQTSFYIKCINVNMVLHNQVINQHCFEESALSIWPRRSLLTDLLAVFIAVFRGIIAIKLL